MRLPTWAYRAAMRYDHPPYIVRLYQSGGYGSYTGYATFTKAGVSMTKPFFSALRYSCGPILVPWDRLVSMEVLRPAEALRVAETITDSEPVAWCCGYEFLRQEEAARHHDEHAASWLARRGVEC